MPYLPHADVIAVQRSPLDKRQPAGSGVRPTADSRCGETGDPGRLLALPGIDRPLPHRTLRARAPEEDRRLRAHGRPPLRQVLPPPPAAGAAGGVVTRHLLPPASSPRSLPNTRFWGRPAADLGAARQARPDAARAALEAGLGRAACGPAQDTALRLPLLD